MKNTKIFCILGKSGVGKDTVFRRLLKVEPQKLLPLIPYTTRPIRRGEIEGQNYHFVTEQVFYEMQREGFIVESREYHTVSGKWIYFTVDDQNKNKMHRVLITTPAALPALCQYYGKERIVVLYLCAADKVRLERCIARESRQTKPNYKEVCRRYLADEQDFNENELMHIYHYIEIRADCPLEETMAAIQHAIN